MTDTEVGGTWGDTGKGPRGQEVTWKRGGVFSKQADQRQPGVDRRCGREALHAPTGDTSVHFLWNVSGIPGNQPTSTTSFARGTHPLTGNCMGSSAGKLHPSCLFPTVKTTVQSQGFQITRKTR